MSDLERLYTAAKSLERAAEILSYHAKGAEERDRAKYFKSDAQLALEDYYRLSKDLPRAMELLASNAREYDRYVTREPEGCSCHINPPCGFCTSQDDPA
jgi:hypothetical protein